MRGIQITPGYMAIKSSEILEELASLRIQYVQYSCIDGYEIGRI